MENTIPNPTVEAAIAETQRFMTKVYGWMSFALVITGFVAMFTASSPAMLQAVFGNTITLIALLIIQFGMVAALAGWVNKMSANTATLVFILYSALNGVTFSGIFIVYTAASIASTFFITAGTFGAMSFYGYTTKSDLTKWGSLLFMALFGLIIASVVNIFMNSTMLYWITTYAGVLIFVGLTAYDTQKIKNMNIIGNEGTEEDKKEAIMGALRLYLDFINLFLYLLRIFGKRK
jgi:FtsH-binding integral membrane protein